MILSYAATPYEMEIQRLGSDLPRQLGFELPRRNQVMRDEIVFGREEMGVIK